MKAFFEASVGTHIREAIAIIRDWIRARKTGPTVEPIDKRSRYYLGPEEAWRQENAKRQTRSL